MPKRSKAEGETLIFSLAYCSRASQSLRSSDIDSIISAARTHNSRQKITGWLVWGSGVFFQWLEGSREDVERLMVAITADSRHNTIVILSESEEVRERLFAGWDMELVSADDIREVLLDAIGETQDPKSLVALRSIIEEIAASELKPTLMKHIDL